MTLGIRTERFLSAFSDLRTVCDDAEQDCGLMDSLSPVARGAGSRSSRSCKPLREQERPASDSPVLGAGRPPPISGAITASAKFVFGRRLRSADEVSGRVMLAALVEVPDLLPKSLMLLPFETPPVFHHLALQHAVECAAGETGLDCR